MRLTVPIQLWQPKHGAGYIAEGLRLAASGDTYEDARIEIEKGITAWCRSLDRAGQLEAALRRANLQPEGNDVEGIHIVTIVTEEKG